ncbi:MAG: hypothetical protein IJD95_00270 [Clostridia bacterium]|nr:hypothetical protein [Clostridia bacterium]
MSKIRNKKGISVAEVIIALSVVVLVSLAALSVVLTSVVKSIDTKSTANAYRFADDVLECFKAADDEAEFLEFVSFARGIELTDGVTGENSFKTYRYRSDEKKITVLISVRYSASERSVLDISVIDDDNEEILSFSYRKGDGI